MTVWTGWSAGARAAGVACGAAVVAIVVAVLWPTPQQAGDTPAAVASVPSAAAVPATADTPVVPSDAPTEAATASVPAEAELPYAAAPVTEEVAEVPDAAADSAAPGPIHPGFDGYRVEADGSAVVSGRAEPSAEISVLVDGVAVAGGKAGADGSFAILFTLAPNPLPSLMSLLAVLADGQTVASEQSVALGPIAGPVVATAAPVADPAPVAEGGAAEAPVEEATATLAPATPDHEPVAPVALLVTEEGATVAQAAEPELAEATQVVAAVVLDAISYSPLGAVQLSGKGQAGQVARIYLDNAAVAEAAVAPTGQWQVTLDDTAPGIYTLRVDQVDESGAVTARVETPFKRETLEALAALTQPAVPVNTPTAVENAKTAADVPATPVPASPEPVVADQTVAETALAEAPPAPAAVDDTAAAQVAAAEDPAPTAPQPAPALAPAEAAVAEPSVPAASPVSITVQPGFTLWGIARDSFGDGVMYVQVYEANREKIRNPDLIYPGQVFTIPGNP